METNNDWTRWRKNDSTISHITSPTISMRWFERCREDWATADDPIVRIFFWVGGMTTWRERVANKKINREDKDGGGKTDTEAWEAALCEYYRRIKLTLQPTSWRERLGKATNDTSDQVVNQVRGRQMRRKKEEGNEKGGNLFLIEQVQRNALCIALLFLFFLIHPLIIYNY